MLAAAKLNPNLWWYLARAGGLVAWALLAASVFWGLWYAGRLSRRMPPRAWTLDLHRFLGGLALIFVVIHVVALTADKFVDFGTLQVLVPFASHWRPNAVALGITAMYLLVAVELTSLAMHLMPKKVWHSIHMLSFVLFAFATIHAIQTGTDMRNPVVLALGALLLLSAVVVAILRVGNGWQRAQGGGASSAPAPARPASQPTTPAWPSAPQSPPATPTGWPTPGQAPTAPRWSPTPSHAPTAPRRPPSGEYAGVAASRTSTATLSARPAAPNLVTAPPDAMSRPLAAPTNSSEWAEYAAAAARQRRPNPVDGPTREPRGR